MAGNMSTEPRDVDLDEKKDEPRFLGFGTAEDQEPAVLFQLVESLTSRASLLGHKEILVPTEFARYHLQTC
jgi:hypothetical protein